MRFICGPVWTPLDDERFRTRSKSKALPNRCSQRQTHSKAINAGALPPKPGSRTACWLHNGLACADAPTDGRNPTMPWHIVPKRGTSGQVLTRRLDAKGATYVTARRSEAEPCWLGGIGRGSPPPKSSQELYSPAHPKTGDVGQQFKVGVTLGVTLNA